MTDHQARQPKGISTGGQFAAVTRPEADLTLAPGTQYASAADVMATRSEHSQLIFVHYDDRLSDEQMDSILAGDWGGAEDAVMEQFDDHSYSRAREEAEELINAAFAAGTFPYEFDDLDEDEVAEAIETIRENDTSDPISDLLRVTPEQLMRTTIGAPTGRLKDSSAVWGANLDSGGSEARRDAILGLLRDHGANTDAEGVSEAVDELVQEGPWDWHEGVRLDLIFTGNVEDVAAAPRDESQEVQRNQLTFTAPRVLLIDPWNGSGHEVSIPATVTKTLEQVPEDGSEISPQGRVCLDSGAGGYSWDEVAGVVKGAYKQWAPSSEWLVEGPEEP